MQPVVNSTVESGGGASVSRAFLVLATLQGAKGAPTVDSLNAATQAVRNACGSDAFMAVQSSQWLDVYCVSGSCYVNERWWDRRVHFQRHGCDNQPYRAQRNFNTL